MTDKQTMSLYRPELKKELLDLARASAIISSLLYDLDLLPEQLDSQEEMTLGLFGAYNRLEGVLLAFRYLELQGPEVADLKLDSKDCGCKGELVGDQYHVEICEKHLAEIASNMQTASAATVPSCEPRGANPRSAPTYSPTTFQREKITMTGSDGTEHLVSERRVSAAEATSPADKLWAEIVKWAHTAAYPDDRLRNFIEEAIKEAHDIGWRNALHVETN